MRKNALVFSFIMFLVLGLGLFLCLETNFVLNSSNPFREPAWDRYAPKLGPRILAHPNSQTLQHYLSKKGIFEYGGFPAPDIPGVDRKDVLTGLIYFPEQRTPYQVVKVSRSDYFKSKYFWPIQDRGRRYLMVNIGDLARAMDVKYMDEALANAPKEGSYYVVRDGEYKEVDQFVDSRRAALWNQIRKIYRAQYPHLSEVEIDRMRSFDIDNDNSDVLVILETDKADPRDLSVKEFVDSLVVTATLAQPARTNNLGTRWSTHYHEPLYPKDSKFGRPRSPKKKKKPDLGHQEISRLVKFKNHSRTLRGVLYTKILELAEANGRDRPDLMIFQTEQTARVLGEKLFFERRGKPTLLGEFEMGMNVGSEQFESFKRLAQDWARGAIW